MIHSARSLLKLGLTNDLDVMKSNGISGGKMWERQIAKSHTQKELLSVDSNSHGSF